MEHLFVSYEIAKELKELGFEEYCLCEYNNQKELSKISDFHKFGQYKKQDIYLSPLYQQVLDWFREKHKIEIIIHPKNNLYVFDVFYNDKKEYITFNGIYNLFTYYQALESAIKEAIKLINQ